MNQGYTGTVSLSTSSATTDANSPTATLTATLSKVLAGPYALQIFDDQGTRWYCSAQSGMSGATVAVAVTPGTNATRTYTAYVAQGGCTAGVPTMDLRSSSSVSVTSIGYTGVASISADALVLDASNNATTVRAFVSKVVPGPYRWGIYVNNTLLVSCPANATSCAATARPPIGSVQEVEVFVAQDLPLSSIPTNDVRTSDSVLLRTLEWSGAVSLTSSASQLDAQTTAATVTATASKEIALPYVLAFYDTLGHEAGSCSSVPSGGSCALSVSLPPGTTVVYRAYVTQFASPDQGPGNSAAESGPVTITSIPADNNVSGVDLLSAQALLLQRFSTQQEACVALGEVEPSNAVYHGTAPDITLDCNAMGIGQALKSAVATLGAAAVIAIIAHAINGTAPKTTTSTVWPPAPTTGSGSGGSDQGLASIERQLMSRRDATNYPQASYRPTDQEVRSMASQCQSQALAGYFSLEDCLTKTLFLPGAAAMGAAQNDASAISGGAPAQLHFVTSSSNALQRGWYKASSTPNDCQLPYDGATINCDEYPFYSTNEAGPPNTLNPIGATLKLVPALENREEGRQLQAMTTTCAMQSGSTVSAPLLGTAYLVAPMPNVLPRTAFICGDPNAR